MFKTNCLVNLSSAKIITQDFSDQNMDHWKAHQMTNSTWEMRLNYRPNAATQDGPSEYEQDPPLPVLIYHAMSLMANCTRMELVIDNMSLTEMMTLASYLKDADEWKSMTNLRLVADCGGPLETEIISRMVPNLVWLHFHDCMGSEYRETTGTEDLEGRLLRLVEEKHKTLKGIHILVGKEQDEERKLFPPLSLIKRLVGSFPQIEWLTVDTMWQDLGIEYSDQSESEASRFLVFHYHCVMILELDLC